MKVTLEFSIADDDKIQEAIKDKIAKTIKDIDISKEIDTGVNEAIIELVHDGEFYEYVANALVKDLHNNIVEKVNKLK